MQWSTQNEIYGSFHPLWGRSYITKLPQLVRQKSLQTMRKSADTTSHEYGLWYHDDNLRHGATHDRARVTSVFTDSPRNLTAPTPKLPPINDYRNYMTTTPTAPPHNTLPTSDRKNEVNFNELRHVDVQLLLKDSSLVALAPNSTRVEKYTFPRGMNEVHLPDIKEINLKFRMADKTLNLRAVPKIED